MLIKILYSLLLPTFLVVPFLYRNKRPAMLCFYRDMAMSFAFRKVYTRMLLLFLLAFHFYHLTIFRNHYDLIPSTVLCFAMLSHNLCERCIYFLQDRRVLWTGMVLSLACLFIPQFMPLGVSIGVMLCGTVFYPSRLLRNILLLPEWLHRPDCHEDMVEISELYFRWDKPKRGSDDCLSEPVRKRRHPSDDVIEDAEFVEIEQLYDIQSGHRQNEEQS